MIDLKDLTEGDIIYMVDVIFRRCIVGKSFMGKLDLMPQDDEADNPQYRAIAPKQQAIASLIKQLQSMQDD